MTNPLISVLMPAYNCAPVIGEAIASIQAQTVGDFELIIIDDGSTDGTAGVVERLIQHDRRLRLLRQENQGVGPALNRGLEGARGRYIARMDADDIALPERFAKQLAYLEEHPEIALVGAWHRMFGAGDSRLVQFPTEPGHLKAALLFRCAISHPTVLMRRGLFKNEGLRYPAQRRCPEDYHLWVDIAQHHEMANLPLHLHDYRIWPGSNCQQPWPGLIDEHVAIQERLLSCIHLVPTPAQRQLHRGLAFDQLPPVPASHLSAHEWLEAIWHAGLAHPFFDKPGLLRVLTGRYLALLRAVAGMATVEGKAAYETLLGSAFREQVDVALPQHVSVVR